MRKLPGGIQAAVDAQKNATRKILWVAGNYSPDIGGAECSLQANACLLKKYAGQIVLTGGGHGDRVIDGIPVIEEADSFEATLSELIEWYQPDAIATQGINSSRVLELTRNYPGKVIYFLRALTDIDFSPYLKNPDFRIVSNSEWIANWFSKKWQAPSIVLHPIVLPWMVVAKNYIPRFISHVGDAAVKGGERIFNIARCLKDQEFLVTKSWPALRDEAGWDAAKIKKLQETEGAVTLFESEFMDFTSLENVNYRSPYQDPKALYAQTKILLFASTWKEPFGRVILEALLNKRPVILSAEAYHERWEGLVYRIEEGDNIENWCHTIRRILSEGEDSEVMANVARFKTDYDTAAAAKILLRDIFTD